MTQPLAYIHSDAKIAQNVVVEPFTTIAADVEIGEGTWIGSNVTIMGGARIGKNCKIYPGAVISATPQDLKFAGEKTLAEIGDNTVIRECATISRGTVDKFTTKIGANCLIMTYVHVAHDCIIGDNCIVGAGSVIRGNIPENSVVVGNPAKIITDMKVQQFLYQQNPGRLATKKMTDREKIPDVLRHFEQIQGS